MFAINNYPYENCNKKCKNPEHGNRINSVLIKQTISDEKIAAFIAKTCKNFARVLDHQGQSALHVAASLHKYAIVEWLINNNAEINLADKQNGHTPLHRAIRSGHFDIAILLLGYGASFEINDRKSKSPAQYCCKPKNYVDAHSNIKEKNHSKEILVWGNNRNYNLGLENKEGKQYPHHLDHFPKEHITIRSVSISRYHCLYVDEKGELYAVGLGDGGRLGTANESTLVLPRRIHLPNRHKNECVVRISAGRNHSIILTSEDRIFTSGLNAYGQLGQPNCSEKSLIFRDIEIDDKIFRDVLAKDYHSVAYTSDSIYASGLNVGQFGLSAADDKLFQPKKLASFSHSIAMVDSSDAAIVCLTVSGLILLYAKFKVKTIRRPIAHEHIKWIAVTGGEPINAAISTKSTTPAEPLEIIVLTSSDAIFLWSNDMQKYLRCYMRHAIPLQQIYWSGKNLLLLSGDGGLYLGHMTRQSNGSTAVSESTEEFVEQKSNRRLDICEQIGCDITLERIPNIDRVTDVSVDQSGESFVVLQENSKRYLSLPVIPDDPISFKSLLTETTECDSFHDIVFHVEDDAFPAHKYIVFSRAEGLRDIVKKSTDKHVHLNSEGLTSKMFELILKYIYENHALTMTDIEDVEASFDPFSGLVNLEIYTLFREFMGKFGVSKFFDRLVCSPKDREPSMRFNRLSYPELYDVTIKCADQMEIRAHRCILSNRLEYFNMMFNSSWSESTREVINLTTVQKEHMEPIINFLYNNDVHLIRKQHYTETFLYHLMEICDRFFVNRLKNIIEVIMIEKMTARKCGDMLEFAGAYNCDLLEAAALEYICQNMGRLLENRCLDHLQIETLEKISTHYHEIYQFTAAAADHLMASLIANDISDEAILSFTDDFQIDLHFKCESHAATMVKSKKTERTSIGRRNYEKEAINLVNNLSIEPNAVDIKKPSTSMDESIIAEAQEISKSISAEMAKWTKVADKKEVKKRIILAGLKSNAILKAETKEQDNLKPFKNTSVASDVESELDQSLNSTTENTSIDSASERTLQFHLSLGDFTLQKAGKVSQKQRKRQLSHSDTIDTSRLVQNSLPWTVSSPQTPNQCTDMPNAWKVNTPTKTESRPTTSTPLKSHYTPPMNIASAGTAAHPTINESFFSSLPSTSAFSHNKSPRTINGSFNKILNEEQKEKEYFHKLKSKSLRLTQMEEAAIAELRKFYNVENVFDEHIEIERKRFVSSTINFAEWKHQ